MKLPNHYLKPFFLAMAVSPVILVSSCQSDSSSAGSADPATTASLPARPVLRLQAEQPEKTVQLPGELKSYEAVNIYPNTEGFVKEVKVDRGSAVKKGQVLAVLDAPEVNAQLAEAQARLQAANAQVAEAQAAHDSNRDTYERILATSQTAGAVSANELLRHKNQMEAAASKLAAARSNHQAAKAYHQAVAELRNYLTIRAPFDGIITERNVHPGALVGKGGEQGGKPLFRLEDNRTLRLELAVPEAYAGELIQSKELTFRVNAFPGQEFKGQLSRSAGSLQTATRTEMIEMDVDNREGLLKPGMYANVRLQVSRAVPAFYVPGSAVVSSLENTFVIRVQSDTTAKVPVRKGDQVGDKVEVFGNLANGDVILERANEEIKDGERVSLGL
ncbi:efflux RND transporter periplasmic adaptor subunit [soil metagenome]